MNNFYRFLLLLAVYGFGGIACMHKSSGVLQPPYPQVKLDYDQQIQFEQRQQQWWQRFNDTALNKLVEQAMQNNHTLKAARANVAAAYAVFDDVDNEGLPKLDFIVDATSQKQIVPGFSDQRVLSRAYRAGGQFRWTLDLFGKLDQAAQAAMADAQSQYWLWRDAQISLIGEVVRAYADVKGIVARLQVADDNIRLLKSTQRIIDSRVAEGFAAEIDATKILSRLRGVQATLPQLRSELAAVKAHLSILVGVTPEGFDQKLLSNELAAVSQSTAGESVELVTSERLRAQFPKLDKPLAIGEPAKLLKRRADVRVAQKRLEAATKSLGVRTADLYPSISIKGFLGFLSGDFADFGEDTQAWSLTPSLTWSIFDRSSIRAKIAAADAKQQAALAAFEQVILKSLSEAQAALVQYGELRQQVQLLGQQVAASERTVELALIQYEGGVTDLLAVLDAQRELLQARDNFVQALTQTVLSQTRIYEAFGGGVSAAEPEGRPTVSDEK